jgi:hypothetical protein
MPKQTGEPSLGSIVCAEARSVYPDDPFVCRSKPVSRSESFVLTIETEIDASITASPGGPAILSDEWSPLSFS